MRLEDFFQEHSRLALAFSGGTDSALLMQQAVKAGIDVHAYYVKTAFQPDFEYRDALRLSEELGCRMTVIELDVLSDDTVRSNPADRCYYCKKNIFGEILKAAARDGYTEVMDGTNASDSSDDRPGMKALEEMKVFSPLRLCDITKSDVRRLSKEAGLWTWDKPSYACLATRVPSGTAIDNAILRRIEDGEELLSKLGFRDYRIRQDGDNARLELRPCDMHLAIDKREQLLAALGESYSKIVIDLEGR